MKKKASLMILILIIGLAMSVIYLNQPFAPTQTNDFYSELPVTSYLTVVLKENIINMMANNESDAISVMKGNELILNEGEYDTISNVASVRKSIISALFGIAESKGLIDTRRTLGEIGIDDKINPLTEKEKLATVEDLLKARSGIYIYSIGESEKMKELRPDRGSYNNNEFFYYNNWDFNALGLIFEKETRMSIGEAFYEWIAKPTGMKRFHPSSIVYQYSKETDIPMYRIYMCTEDLVRFGSLYANNGMWHDLQIIPGEWVDETFTVYSEVFNVEKFTGYGYLWWIKDDIKPQQFWAVGSGGQFILVDRDNHLVISMMNNTGTSPVGVKLYQMMGKKESTYQEVVDIYSALVSEK